MITIFVRRVLPLAGLVIIMGAAVRQQVLPGPDNDLWFHLRFGREFLSGWSIRDPGHLSTFDSADWIATQWGPQIGLAWLADHGGLGGVLWVVGTLIVVFVAIVYLGCRREAAPLPAALATGLTYVAAAPGLGPRPQLISYLLIAIVCTAWLRTMQDHRPRYWLIALAWVWPTLHGMWLVGVVLGAVALAGLVLQRSAPATTLRRLAVIPVASLAASACTPVGLDAFRSISAVGKRSHYFTEWAPPSFTGLDTLPLLLMLVVVMVDALRRGAMDWNELLWVGLALAWALYSVRTAPVAAIMVAPLVARAVQRHVPAVGPPSRWEVSAVLAAAAVSSAVLVPVASARVDGPVVAPWVDRRLDALPASSVVLDEWDFGAYLLYRHPDLQVVMHGYGDVFTERELDRNVQISRLQPDWRSVVDDLGPTVALVDPRTPLGYALISDAEVWQVIEQDDTYALLEYDDRR